MSFKEYWGPVLIAVVFVTLAAVALPIVFCTFAACESVPGYAEPVTEAGYLIKYLVNKPATPQVSAQVQFKPGDSFNARAVAENSQSGITAEGLDVIRGDFEDYPVFELSESDVLTYIGSIPKNIRLWAVCSAAKDVKLDVTALQPQDSNWIVPENLCSAIPENETCCVLALRNTR